MVHGRFVDEESGLLRSHYLKIIDVLQPEGTDGAPVNESYDASITLSAETITKRIIEYTDGAQLDMTKLKGIGTDGAATMIGVCNGVVTRLKAVSPSSIGVHCAAHRLNLAASQAGNAVPYVKKFNIIICQIFDFFDNSCVRTAGLRAVQSLLQEKGKLTAPSTTRWLSHDKCVQKLKSSFTFVVLSLHREGEERSDAKAVGLARMICEYHFVCTMLLMFDTLPVISHLSRCFQYDQCDYSIIPSMLSSTLTSLEQLTVSGGFNLQNLPAFLEQLETSGIEVKKVANLDEDYFLRSVRRPFLQFLVVNLQARFADKSILASFNVFNPKSLPTIMNKSSKSQTDKAMAYGNNEIELLSSQFSEALPSSSSAEVLSEWSVYKQFMMENCTKMSLGQIITDLSNDTTKGRIYPNMTTLAKICRVIPIHTANVERTFLQLKLTETRVRNRMNEKTLDALLRIGIEGPADVHDFLVGKRLNCGRKRKTGKFYCCN